VPSPGGFFNGLLVVQDFESEQPRLAAVFWKKAGGLWKQTAKLQLNSGSASG